MYIQVFEYTDEVCCNCKGDARMLLKPIGFLLFSTLEGVAVFALILSIFKVKMIPYLWQAIFVNLIMNLQSYMLREEFSFSYLVPVVNMLLLFFTCYGREDSDCVVRYYDSYRLFCICRCSVCIPKSHVRQPSGF